MHHARLASVDHVSLPRFTSPLKFALDFQLSFLRSEQESLRNNTPVGGSNSVGRWRMVSYDTRASLVEGCNEGCLVETIFQSDPI